MGGWVVVVVELSFLLLLLQDMVCVTSLWFGSLRKKEVE